MAQIEIYEFLKQERILKNDSYFTAEQVYNKLLQSNGHICHRGRIYAGLVQLEAYGYLEVKREGKIRNWHRAFRLKGKYVNGLKT